MNRSKKTYQEINSETIDRWVQEGWEWGIPIDHATFERACRGDWEVVVTPNRPVPREWFGEISGKRLLGLASGGGQQIPIFAAAGAQCTVLDYSEVQLASERLVAEREGYEAEIVRADMTKPLPFADGSFDLIFHPVSNSYIRDVFPLFRECYRVLKKGGILICGLDTGINYIVDDEEREICYGLPFDPQMNEEQWEMCLAGDFGIQFSHTLEEQIGGQLQAGFRLTHLLEDLNGKGRLCDLKIPAFIMTRAVKDPV